MRNSPARRARAAASAQDYTSRRALRDSQPSPLALLAATCSKIGTPGENQATGQQQIIIDPNQGLVQLQNQPQHPSSSNNGSSSPSKTKPGNSSATNPGQFQVIQVQNPSGSVQYQVIPQVQTTEGQQIQINPATTTGLQDIQGQIQLIPAGSNQAILTSTVPVQIRPGVSIPLQLQTIPGTQAQVVTTLPINIGGVTLALPVINNVAAGGSSGQVGQSTEMNLVRVFGFLSWVLPPCNRSPSHFLKGGAMAQIIGKYLSSSTKIIWKKFSGDWSCLTILELESLQGCKSFAGICSRL
uniref:Sp4 transcription factor n=1 Tax=Nothoprocta perdicaria TaxID=30464 RepID=A0A8C6ZAJ3_NOTPE